MTALVIGVDGGGSATRVVLADEQGATLASADGAGSAVHPGDEARSADIIGGLVREALARYEGGGATARVLCAGVAGVGREGPRQALRRALVERELADEVLVRPDAGVAFTDAFADGAGILLIAGTGSIALGRGPTGAEARCGGWGPVIGDEGSGAWIGRRVLSAVTAALDGREPDTALVGAVLTALELTDPTHIIDWAATATPAALAALAPLCAGVAEGGDRRASSLLSLAAEELALHVRTLARDLFHEERASFPLALAGGLLAPGSSLRRRVEHRVKSAAAGADVRSEPVVPVRGAVREALRALAGAAS